MNLVHNTNQYYSTYACLHACVKLLVVRGVIQMEAMASVFVSVQPKVSCLTQVTVLSGRLVGVVTH